MERNHGQYDKRSPSGQRIAVLCGGISPEREVSLRSGERIAAALRRRGYRVAIVDPSADYSEKEMRFYIRHRRVCSCEIRKKRRSSYRTHGKSRCFTASALQFCQRSDAVFMALHGGAGEDGRIAAALECFGIPHTGSDHKGLCVSMDKALSKRLMAEAGIPTPEYVLLKPNDAANHGDLPCECSFPCVIKPTCGGSSIGVKMAENEAELRNVLNAYKGSGELIAERKIIGREFTVGVLNGEALAVTEIIPKSGFYDYRNKYTKGATEEITPAKIDEKLKAELKRTAISTHKALCLGAYSRVDIMMEEETDRVYVLEANALPGMTETSLLPQGAKAVGTDFDDLCEKMLKSSFKQARGEG